MSVAGNEKTETQLRWIKSSFSAGDGGECVEVAGCASAVRVRDSKVADGPWLTVGRAVWGAFVREVASSSAVN